MRTLTILGLCLTLSACSLSTTGRNADLIVSETLTRVCKSWTPVTDTTSPQTRANNRGRFALCEPNQEKSK